MKKINWKLRLKNKTTLLALLTALVAFIYQVCAALNIVPTMPETTVVNGIKMVLTILVALGVVVDPTTAGIEDSERAMKYSKPKEAK